MDSLPNIVLHKIFSLFTVDYRMNCLELVCKKWKSLQYYDDQKHVNLNDFHRKFCIKGSSCPLERYKRYPMLYRKIFKKKMVRILTCIRNHLNQSLESLDVDKFYINEDIMQIICELPFLSQINLSASTITPGAIQGLNRIKKLKSLIICDAQLDLIDFDRLIVHYFKSINQVHISKLPLEFLNSLRSIDAISLLDGNDLFIIGEQCPNLRNLCLKYCHNIQSDHQMKILADNIGPHLTSLTIGLKPPYIENLFKNCPTLGSLDLRILQDRHIETNLTFLRHLPRLNAFRLTCRWLKSLHLLDNISKCEHLLYLDLNAKRFNYFDEPTYFQDLWRLSDLDYEKCSMENESSTQVVYDILWFPTFQCTFGQDDTADRTVSGPCVQSFEFKLHSVKLSLDNVVTSTKVANLILKHSPRLKTIKLMNKLIKFRYNSEHMVVDDQFCRDYYYNLSLKNSSNLDALCLPCLDLISEDSATLEILQFLRYHPLRKLYIYGGSLFFPDPVSSLIVHENLTSLSIGPYLRSFSGVDRLIASLPNLQRLSFHGQSNGGMNRLLHEIGCHRSLKKVDIYNLTNYFVENIDVEILPIIDGRSRLARSGTTIIYESLNIDGYLRTRYGQLPIFVEDQLQSVNIKFRFLYN